MITPEKDKLEKAKERFMSRFPIERIRKFKKYRDISKKEYFLLVNNLEKIGILLLEFYIFTLKE